MLRNAAAKGRESPGPYQTSPKAPAPTGCKSVYLQVHRVKTNLSLASERLGLRSREIIPAGDLECGAQNLATDELIHLEQGREGDRLYIDCGPSTDSGN